MVIYCFQLCCAMGQVGDFKNIPTPSTEHNHKHKEHFIVIVIHKEDFSLCQKLQGQSHLRSHCILCVCHGCILFTVSGFIATLKKLNTQ